MGLVRHFLLLGSALWCPRCLARMYSSGGRLCGWFFLGRYLVAMSSFREADLMGHLIIAFMDPSSGHVYHVDFGLSHGLDGCPLNLLSLPLLFQAGSMAHFEPGNCYFQLRPDSARIPFE